LTDGAVDECKSHAAVVPEGVGILALPDAVVQVEGEQRRRIRTSELGGALDLKSGIVAQIVVLVALRKRPRTDRRGIGRCRHASWIYDSRSRAGYSRSCRGQSWSSGGRT
jgi:hypothetical protein